MKKKKKVVKKRTVRKVYTYGVFDLFHSGHAQLLKKAKKLGDHLVVGLFTDEVAAGFKRQPVIPYEHRRAVLSHITFVDEVIPQDELLPHKNIRKIKPHILAKGPGAGWEPEMKSAPGEEAIKAVGGKVVRLPYHEGISTSQIIKKITDTHGNSLKSSSRKNRN